MSTYQNQIQIVLFDNNSSNEKAPVQRGTVEFPDGTKYEVALWNKVSKNGNPFKSGTLKLLDPNAQQGYRKSDNPGRPARVQVDF